MEETSTNALGEISQSDWDKTPESVQRLLTHLIARMEQWERQVEELKVENQLLREENERLKAENQLLKERLQQNSKNSSKPPSTGSGKGFKPKEQKQKSKKNPGGQPGHEGHERPFYPIEQCQRVEDYYPDNCIHCGQHLSVTDEVHEAYRVQIVEIPKVVPQVSEHRFHARHCQHCGVNTRAWVDAIINGSGYGERVTAYVSVLSGQYRQSHRMVQSLLDDLFGVKLSVGSIQQLRQESSEAVAPPVAEAHRYVQQQGVINIDETGFSQGNADGRNPGKRKGWLWVIVTPLVSYFAVCLSRSQSICQQLLGEGFDGIVGSDRYSAYNCYEPEQRQLCWAHLKRDFTRISERPGAAGALGKALLEQQKLLFESWYRVRDGTLSREAFARVVKPIREQVHTLLSVGGSYELAKGEKTVFAQTVRTCRQLLKVEASLWTFVTTEGVEPTNNGAERALRPAVLWRKNSFGSQSQNGSLFVSRMLTVMTTLRAQNRSVLDYLVEACRAARQGKPAPSLLPGVCCTT